MCDAGHELAVTSCALSTSDATSSMVCRGGFVSSYLSVSTVSCGDYNLACYFEGMPAQKVVPDVVSISAAMLACIEGACWTTALQLFADMPSLTLTPDVLSS